MHERNVCVVNFWIKSGMNSDESLNRDGAKRRIAAPMSVLILQLYDVNSARSECFALLSDFLSFSSAALANKMANIIHLQCQVAKRQLTKVQVCSPFS